MIFTEEQLARLPGSTVRLRNGTECIVGWESLRLHSHVALKCDKNGTHDIYGECYANIKKCDSTEIDIVEVIQWADEKHQPAVPGNITTSTTMGVHTFAGVKTVPKQARKVVQICATENVLTALCDDGTIWECGICLGWVKMTPIPQPEDEE